MSHIIFQFFILIRYGKNYIYNIEIYIRDDICCANRICIISY